MNIWNDTVTCKHPSGHHFSFFLFFYTHKTVQLTCMSWFHERYSCYLFVLQFLSEFPAQEVKPQAYRNAYDIPRRNLLDQVTRMRSNLLRTTQKLIRSQDEGVLKRHTQCLEIISRLNIYSGFCCLFLD